MTGHPDDHFDGTGSKANEAYLRNTAGFVPGVSPPLNDSHRKLTQPA